MTVLRGQIGILGLVLVAIAAAPLLVMADGDAGPVVICLAESVELDSGVVTLADLVIPEQAATDAARMLATIDLLQRSGDEKQEISRDLIELRLRLAGYAPEQVLLVGPERVVVQANRGQSAVPMIGTPIVEPALLATTAVAAESPFNAAEIEAAAATAIASQLGVTTEELRVTLTSSFTGLATSPVVPLESRRCEVIPLGDRLLGRIGCLCRLFDGPRLVRSWNASLLVEQRRRVLVASRSLERGESVTADALREETRYLTEAVDDLTLSLVEGRRVRSTIRPGQLVSLRQLEAVGEAAGQVVIQPRQVVQVTACRPGLQVRLRQAQSLDSGRVGDMIRIRNDDSGRVISGRVAGPGSVEIALE